MPLPERRGEPRVDCFLPGALVTEIGTQGAYQGDEEWLIPTTGTITNLSRRGLLIEARTPVCPGREVRVSFCLFGRQVAIRGQVVRTAHLRSGRCLLALRLRPTTRVQRLIHQMIDARRTHPILN